MSYRDTRDGEFKIESVLLDACALVGFNVLKSRFSEPDSVHVCLSSVYRLPYSNARSDSISYCVARALTKCSLFGNASINSRCGAEPNFQRRKLFESRSKFSKVNFRKSKRISIITVRRFVFPVFRQRTRPGLNSGERRQEMCKQFQSGALFMA